MFSLLFVLLPLCHSLPQIPDVGNSECRLSGCQVSDIALNAALSVFLCYPEEKAEDMDEIDRKLLLAEKIAPLISSPLSLRRQVDEYAKMESDKLVQLVNLVLHNPNNRSPGAKKTVQNYYQMLVSALVKKTNHEADMFVGITPILLGLLNCQTQPPQDDSPDCSCNGLVDEQGEGECRTAWPYGSDTFWCYVEKGSSCPDAEEWIGQDGRTHTSSNEACTGVNEE